MKKRSQVAKELRPFLLNSIAASSTPEVNINEIVAKVRDVIGSLFVTDAEFLEHTGNSDAHHAEIHDIIEKHTATGTPYSVIGLDEGAALEVLPTKTDGRTGHNSILRSNDSGGLGLTELDVDRLVGQTGNIDVLTPLKSENFASQTTGFRIIPDTGEADFRSIYADEMSIKIFYAQLVRALSGIDLIAKSVAELFSNFVAPNPGSSTNFIVNDHKVMPGVARFESGDVVAVQQFTRSGSELAIGFCWGTVTGYTNLGSGRQRWTFTRSTGTNAGTMAAGTTIQAGAVVLDYGKSGSGYVEINAIDGPNAANAPYLQCVQWFNHPATGKIVRTRLGNLRGLGFDGKFGLYVRGVDANQYLLANGDGITGQNTTDKAFNGSSQTYQRDPNGTLRIGSDISDPATTALAILSAAQTYAGSSYGAGDLLIGNPSGANIFWDASTGKIYFRQGATVRAFIDTDGTFKAGGGAVKLDTSGINIEVLASGGSTAFLRFLQSGVLKSSISSFHGTGPIPDLSDGLVIYDAFQIILNSAVRAVTLSVTGAASFGNFGLWSTVNAAGSGGTVGVFSSGWTNVGTVGSSTYEACQYRRVGDVVRLRGLVKRTSGSATTIFTLPTGYRPLKRCWRTCQVYDTGYKIARVDVDTNGVVSLVDAGGATAINFLNLDLEFSVVG